MKSILLGLGFVLTLLDSNAAFAQAPFERVLQLVGKGMDYPVQVATYDASVELGFAPDLVVSSCGGYLGSALIQGFPDAEARYEFLKSDRMFAIAKGVKVLEGSGMDALKKKTISWVLNKKGDQKNFPDLFTEGVLEGTRGWFDLPELKIKPGSAPAHIGIGFELLADARKGGFEHQKDEKPFLRETWFTDPDTAQKIRAAIPDLRCDVKGDHPASWICEQVQIETDFEVGQIGRVSTSDQFVFPRPIINDRAFLTGGGDLYPSNLIRSMGRTAIAEFPPSFDLVVTSPAAWEVFGYDGNARIRKFSSMNFEFWIDQTDYLDLYTKGLGLNPLIGVGLDGLKYSMNVASDLDGFRNQVDALYLYGYLRTYEGLVRAGKGEIGHIRRLDYQNVDRTRKAELGAKKWKNDGPGLVDLFLADSFDKIPPKRKEWVRSVVERIRKADSQSGPYRLLEKLNDPMRK